MRSRSCVSWLPQGCLVSVPDSVTRAPLPLPLAAKHSKPHCTASLQLCGLCLPSSSAPLMTHACHCVELASNETPASLPSPGTEVSLIGLGKCLPGASLCRNREGSNSLTYPPEDVTDDESSLRPRLQGAPVFKALGFEDSGGWRH